MKNFLIALVLAIIVVNCLGSVFNDWFGVHLMMSDELLGPWESIAALTALGVVLVAVGFVVAVSVLGTIFLAVAASLLALFVVGVSAFWPIILLVILIYSLKGKPARQQSVSHQL